MNTKKIRWASILMSVLCVFYVSSLNAQSTDNTMDEQMAYLQDRLNASRTHGMWWQWGWMGLSAGALGYNAANAAIRDGNKRTGNVVESVKSAVGIVYLSVSPMEARHGSRNVPADGSLEDRIKAAEKLLRTNAERARERTDWKLYAGNALLQGAGLGVTLGWGRSKDAWINFAAGMAGGSLQIWSAPGRPQKDWDEYQERFKGMPAKQTRWWISPNTDLNGLALTYVF